MNRFVTIALLLFLGSTVNAQDSIYARKLINKLAGAEYKGRGYEYNYQHKAANFIAAELQKKGAVSFTESYFQEFSIKVNTFPKKVGAWIDGKELQIGVDYILSDFSPSVKGRYELYWQTDSILKPILFTGALTNRFLVLSQTKAKWATELRMLCLSGKLKCKGVITLHDKLPFRSPSGFVAAIPELQITQSALPDSTTHIKLHINNKFIPNFKGQNVCAYVPGKTDSTVVFTAHYDHLGTYGNTVYFPGAHDNASGTAMVLDLARHYATAKDKPHYTMVFLLLTGEELGLLGATHFAENPLFDLPKTRFLINLDILAGGTDGVKLVNGTEFTKEFDSMVAINEAHKLLKTVLARAPAANSDHYPFYHKGVPSFFMYALGNYKQYHNIRDKPEGLPLPEYNDMFRLITYFVEGLKL